MPQSLMVTQGSLCLSVVRYVVPDEARFWKSIPEYESKSWSTFRAAVINLYPGAEVERMPTRADLEAMVTKQASESSIDIASYGKFLREFTLVANKMENARRIAQYDVNELFMQAFVGEFGQLVKSRVAFKQVDHPRDEPFLLQDVDEAARYYLICGKSYSAAVVKQEPPVVKRDRHHCWFCGGDHAISWCVERAAYERAGKILMCNGRVFMSDGSEVPIGSQRSMTIQQRVDEALSAGQKSSRYRTFGQVFEPGIRVPSTPSVDACGRHNIDA